MHEILKALESSNKKFKINYPGLTGRRQPVHTVYGGAHLFNSKTAQKIAETAQKTLSEYAPKANDLMRALEIIETDTNVKLWETIYSRVQEKLAREAVEDFRIDFEDGYGNRPQAEEDGHAKSTALEVAKGMAEGSLPPFIGIRIKTFNEENIQRSVRTLEIFLTQLISASNGQLPSGFVITLPKITDVAQSRTLAEILTKLEIKLKLPAKSLFYEIMVEMPQAIFDLEGRSPLRSFVDAGQGRCIAAHFGTYDYTAGCNITAAHQTMKNPVCDFAKHMMQVTLAGTPVMLSDGATNVMPVGPFKGTSENPLTENQKSENRNVVHRAWRLSYDHIQHSLVSGFYQGWDLHPAQLPIRYAAVYGFFLEGLDAATQRLSGFIEKAAKATLLGDVFDDAATGQGLLNYFLRGLSSGAVTEKEALKSGLSIKEIQSRSFLKILEGRKIV